MPVTPALPANIVMSPPATCAVSVLNRVFSPSTASPRAVKDCLMAAREPGSVVMITRCGAAGEAFNVAATAWSILWLTFCPKSPVGTRRTAAKSATRIGDTRFMERLSSTQHLRQFSRIFRNILGPSGLRPIRHQRRNDGFWASRFKTGHPLCAYASVCVIYLRKLQFCRVVLFWVTGCLDGTRGHAPSRQGVS